MGVDARSAVRGAALEGAVFAVALGAAVVAPPAVTVRHVHSSLGVASFRRPSALRVTNWNTQNTTDYLSGRIWNAESEK